MLSIAEIDQLRALLSEADAPVDAFASCCGKPRAEKALTAAIRPHYAELLAAAEAIAKIKPIARDETDLGDFSRRVGVVLAELERGR